VALTPTFWRRWHRWIGLPAALFLLWAGSTGVLVAGTEFFGEDEALREATRDLVSPVTSASAPSVWQEPLARAIGAVATASNNAPIDKIEMQFKGDAPTITIFTGKAAGGEDRKFVVNAKTGVIASTEAYADKPFLYRLHSGEAFGDGGLVVAMVWGLTLVALTISGFNILWRMRRRDVTGWRRYFF
jgi:uncharacterized iron-regulated membrane protein